MRFYVEKGADRDLPKKSAQKATHSALTPSRIVYTPCHEHHQTHAHTLLTIMTHTRTTYRTPYCI